MHFLGSGLGQKQILWLRLLRNILLIYDGTLALPGANKMMLLPLRNTDLIITAFLAAKPT
jgi:hypothetical protein